MEEKEEEKGSSLVKIFSECQIGERKVERMEEGSRDKVKKKEKKKKERERKEKIIVYELFFSRIISLFLLGHGTRDFLLASTLFIRFNIKRSHSLSIIAIVTRYLEIRINLEADLWWLL